MTLCRTLWNLENHRNIQTVIVLSLLEDDDNQMKKLIGLLVLCIAFSLSAVAQHGGP
jgi:hypothetical protein